MPRRKRKNHEEHENHERWLVSYADFITLLFAFFVVMYSISSVSEGKYRVLSDSITAAFRAPPSSLNPIQVGNLIRTPFDPGPTIKKPNNVLNLPPFPIPKPGKRGEAKGEIDDDPQAQKGLGKGLGKMLAIAEKMESSLENLIADDSVFVDVSEDWVEVEINNRVLFFSGSATLTEKAIPVLKKIAGNIKDIPNEVRVEGYTDNLPINSFAFRTNWELSSARSSSVVTTLMSGGVDPGRLAAVGYGEFRPKADNSTARGRQQNRRVTIKIMKSKPPPALNKNAISVPFGDENKPVQGFKKPGASSAAPSKTSPQGAAKPTDRLKSLGS